MHSAFAVVALAALGAALVVVGSAPVAGGARVSLAAAGGQSQRAALAAAADRGSAPLVATAPTCEDGVTHCSKNETCCGRGDNTFCCGSGTSCCNGTECCYSATESCCASDQFGGVCCVKENTFCCPRLGEHPSRCCPRWTACCMGGRFGCCPLPNAPAHIVAQFAPPLPQSPLSPAAAPRPAAAAAAATAAAGGTTNTSVAFGLLLSAFSGFGAMQIDVSSAEYKWKELNGFENYMEEPRAFTYSARRNVFFLPQANWTGVPPPPPPASLPVTLWAIDPVSAIVSKQTLTNAKGQVAGFDYSTHLDALLMATFAYAPDSGAHVGYRFWRVDVRAGHARYMGKSAFAADGKDDYAGWFHAAEPDGSVLYRAGYLDEATSTSPGVLIVNASKPDVTTRFVAVEPPQGLGWYQTLTRVGRGEFVSLAAPVANPAGELSVVWWSVNGTSRVVGTSDAHRTPEFGPVLGAYTAAGGADHYVALVVENGIMERFDHWSLLSVTNVTSAAPHTTVTRLDPWTEGPTDSAVGMGIPLPSLVAQH